MAKSRLCSIESCGKQPINSRGWCHKHYNRWLRHGDPLGGGTAHGEPEQYLHDVVLAYEGDECLFWPYATDLKGYARIRQNGENTVLPRIICEKLHGPAPSAEHQAAHSCGKGHLGCVTKRHLSWKTPSGNQMDRVIHNTSNRGERCGSAKLTEIDVRQIRAMKATMPQHNIAALFGVSQALVSSILSGTRWAWLE